jgi:formylglycine-generating enzyme required for sulfatase activity
MAAGRKAEHERQDQEHLVLEEQQPQREKAERAAHDRTASVDMPSQIPSTWPESSGPELPDGAERSVFGPMETATLRREGTTWEIERYSIETWGFRERLAEGVELKMVAIPGGTFLMGSPEGEEGRSEDESPQHKVKLKAFFLGQTPITQAQWRVVAGWEKVELDLDPDPAWFKGPNHPVEHVSWLEAQEFCRRLSARTGRSYCLPSEAQLEYSCRAGSTTLFHFGNTITAELANSTYTDGPKGTYRQQTTPVGSFPANSWGLQDMHGNVWEWCLDHRHANYEFAPEDDQPWLIPAAGDDEYRLLRGGSWGLVSRFCRSACRHCNHPDNRGSYYGFGLRVVCLPPGSSS